MTDLRTLTDAFTELERRADAAGSTFELPAPRRRTPRLVPVAAGLAVAAGLVAGAVVLTRDPGTQTAGPPVSTTQPPADTSAPVTVIMSPEELADRFRVVLGNLATFEVTETGAPVEMTVPDIPGSGDNAPTGVPVEVEPTPNGAAIVGTLTSAGVTGGFDLQIYRDSSGGSAFCFDAYQPCVQRTLPDGTQVAFWPMPLNGAPGSVTYTVSVYNPNGRRLLLHLSNQQSPKGQSEKLADQPPLTMEQLVAIATSDLW